MGLLLLVRHGQASFGAEDYDVLSEVGWVQGRLLGAALAGRGVVPTVLVRGTMRRHRETLEAMLDGRPGGSAWPDDTRVDAAWDEFDHLSVVAGYPGLPDGPLDRRGFQAVFERATARWAAGDGDYDETYAAFLARVRGALSRAADAAGPAQTVVVVTSGGAIAAACAALVDPDGDDPVATARIWARFNTVVANSSVTRVVVGSTGARLLTFNEHAHVAGETLTYR